jgi:hypothetical protein
MSPPVGLVRTTRGQAQASSAGAVNQPVPGNSESSSTSTRQPTNPSTQPPTEVTDRNEESLRALVLTMDERQRMFEENFKEFITDYKKAMRDWKNDLQQLDFRIERSSDRFMDETRTLADEIGEVRRRASASHTSKDGKLPKYKRSVPPRGSDDDNDLNDNERDGVPDDSTSRDKKIDSENDNNDSTDYKNGKGFPKMTSTPRARKIAGSRKTLKHHKESDSTDPSSSSSEDDARDRKNSKSKKNKSDSDTDNESTDYSDEFKRGPSFKHVKEIKTRSPLLRYVLSYRSYRLQNTSQRFSNSQQRNLSRISKRMQTHIPDDQRFDGSDPVSVIRFLEEFKDACDHNGVSEGAAMHLFQYFLLDPAKKGLRLHYRSTMNPSSNSYCGAVQFLLSTYAAEEEVSGECRKIFLMQQRSGENERDFGIRIQAQAGRLGQAFSEENLVTAYLNGVPENIRTYVSSATPNAVTFAQIHIAAYNAGRTLKQRVPTSNPIHVSGLPQVRRQSRTGGPVYVLSNTPEHQSKDWNTPATSATQAKRNLKCFLCDKEHLLHECPTLTPEQRKQAQQVNQRFMARRADGPNVQNYRGAGFSRTEPTYVLNFEEDQDEPHKKQDVTMNLVGDQEQEN